MCSLVGNNYKCSCVSDFFGTNCQHKVLNSTSFVNSTILTNEMSINLVKLIEFNNTNFKLLYQASRDGFDNKIFHSKCDGVGRTLTVMKSKNSNIFGGYTAADWSGYGIYRSDSTAFLYSLVNSYNVAVKMSATQADYAIYAYPYYSIVLGAGNDLYCSNDQCSSNLGYSYKLPSFLTYGSSEPQSLLGGSYNFQAVEIEVYWVVN